MNFDLNIDNYTKADIEHLLDLKNPYSSQQIQDKCLAFKTSVAKSSTDAITISNINIFLDKVREKLNNINLPSDLLLSDSNFENPNLTVSKLHTDNGHNIIEQHMRTSNSANSSTTTLPSHLGYALPGDEAPGIINPLYKRSILRSLTIDSRFRDNYYYTNAANYLVNLPNRFTDVISIQLASIELPTTFYAISKSLGNNYFWIKLRGSVTTINYMNPAKWKSHYYDSNSDPISTDVTTLAQQLNSNSNPEYVSNSIHYAQVVIPDGNYTHVDLTAYLNNELTSLFTNTTDTGTITGSFINVKIDLTDKGSGSGRTIISSVSFTSSNANNNENKAISAAATRFEINFSCPYIEDFDNTSLDLRETNYNKIDSTPLPLKFGWILGYRNTLYSSYNKLAESGDIEINALGSSPDEDELSNLSGSTYLSEGFFECAGPRYLFLVVDDFNNNVNNGLFSAFNSSVLNKNILARIPIKGTPFSVFVDDVQSLTAPPRQYFGPVNLDKFRIQLLDEFGRIINLHNMDFSFGMNIVSIYDK